MKFRIANLLSPNPADIPTLADLLKATTQNYIYDQLQASGDPLITLLARTPVHADYKQLVYIKRTFKHNTLSKDYISFQHVYLFTLLHKLGLRGGSRVE